MTLTDGSRLMAAESDRMARVARVYVNAVEILGDEAKAAE
jgi:uncharacterized protein (DUF2384 family)